jgi:hypothetical protein
MAREDLRSGDDVRDDVLSAPGPPEVRRDRKEHGGSTDRFDDDALAARTEQERVDAGLADYAPGSVPPATDDPVPVDLTATAAYREEKAQIDLEVDRGLIATEGERPDFPPSRYPDS